MSSARSEQSSEITALSSVKEGSTVRLARLDCGRGMSTRLASMGLRTGTEFRVVQAAGSGPIVVAVGNSRYALGRGVTDRMMVTLEKTP